MTRLLRPLRLLLLALIAGWFWPSPALAGSLPLPVEAAPLKSAIRTDCPDCLDKGVTACGTADVQYGQRFTRHFFAGTPNRGYLPAFRLSGAEFERMARTMPPDILLVAVYGAFVGTPLIVIEDGFATARVIKRPLSVEASFPAALHQCLQNQSKPWGCCLAADCQGECCEKNLGSPTLTVTWRDDANDETLVFSFGHSPGTSTLTRQSSTGRTLYWCLTDETGRLRWR
jgi:hypothetical protein